MTPRNQPTPLSLWWFDYRLLFPCFLLVGIGLGMVYSASAALAVKKYGAELFFFQKQVLFAVLGLMVLMICRYFPYRWYGTLAYPLLIVAFGLLILVQLTSLGVSAGGARRWLSMGYFNLQPTELVRLFLILYLAYSLSRKQDQVRDFYIGFLPHVMVLALFSVFIFLQPDFGSVMILCVLTWTMLFLGGVRLKHLILSLIVLVPIAVIALLAAGYRIGRLEGYWDIWAHAHDKAYQVIHSLMAFGSGGIAGSGLGNSHQKLFYLPEPHTDFIFSVIGEELGLIGVLFVVLLFSGLLLRGIMIAVRTKDTFGCLLAAGLTLAILMGATINMGVTLGLLPTKGLPLPFVSYGGSSLLVNMAAIGILMNIAASERV